MDPILWNWSLNEVLGYALGFVIVFAFGVFIHLMPRPKWYRRLLLGGLVLKCFASWAYIALFTSVYGGGDFDNYMLKGYQLYKALVTQGWETYASSDLWMGGIFTGTTFVDYVCSLLGIPVMFSMHGLALIFSMLGFCGQILFVETFANAFPEDKVKRFAVIVMTFPSLSFWPSSVGKDALLFFGLGMVFYGLSLFVVSDKRRRKRMIWVVVGMALIFFVRPQVAALVGLSLGISLWLSTDRRWTPARFAQAALLLAGALWVASIGFQAVGINSLDGEGVSDYIERKSYYSGRESSQSGVSVSAATNPLQALVNVLFRPFPWEAGSLPLLIAATELAVLWGFIIYRFGTVSLFVRQNRRSRVFVAAIAFLVLYSVGFGMSVANLGIIARQRIHIFPMIVMLVSAAPRRRLVVVNAPSRPLPMAVSA